MINFSLITNSASYGVLAAWSETINTHFKSAGLGTTCFAFPGINSKVCLLRRDVPYTNETVECEIADLLHEPLSPWEEVDKDSSGTAILLAMFDPLGIENRVKKAIDASIATGGLRIGIGKLYDSCILCGASTSLFYKASLVGYSPSGALEHYEGENGKGERWIVRSSGSHVFSDKSVSEVVATYRYPGNNFGSVWQQWKINT